MSRFIGAAVLGVCLMASVAIVSAQAQDMAQNGTPGHQWNDHEDQVWHQYLKDHHRKDHDWAKASKREQKEYWKWRDKHPDSQ
jgi:hypothetical protein